MAIYMLFDNPADKQNMTFLNGYETAKIRQVYPSQKCNSTKEMLTACKDMIRQSAEGDTIICWYDFMAVLCWWLCKVQFKNRKIIALNILLKDKATAKNKLAKFLYKPMLKSKKVQATVTSKKYGEHLNEMLESRSSTRCCMTPIMVVTALNMKEKLIRIPCSAAAGTVATGSF